MSVFTPVFTGTGVFPNYGGSKMATFAILIHDSKNPMGAELSRALVYDVNFDEACLIGALLARTRHPEVLTRFAVVDVTLGG
jgi:hypothetical protein